MEVPVIIEEGAEEEDELAIALVINR